MMSEGSVAKMSTAQLRKIKKPIIERRRRGRINESLNQLKALVLEALHKDESRYSKMEKADILEMTVKHLKAVQKQQAAMTTTIAMATGQDVYSKYHAGFSECAHEIRNYLGQVNGVTPDVEGRLMQHLEKVSRSPVTRTLTSTPGATPLTSLPGSQLVVGMTQMQPLSVAVPPVVAVMSRPQATTAPSTGVTPTTGSECVNLNSAIPLYISPRTASSPGSTSTSPALSTSSFSASSSPSRSSTPNSSMQHSPAFSDDVTMHCSQTVLHHQMACRDVTKTSPIVIQPSSSVWRPW